MPERLGSLSSPQGSTHLGTGTSISAPSIRGFRPSGAAVMALAIESTVCRAKSTPYQNMKTSNGSEAQAPYTHSGIECSHCQELRFSHSAGCKGFEGRFLSIGLDLDVIQEAFAAVQSTWSQHTPASHMRNVDDCAIPGEARPTRRLDRLSWKCRTDRSMSLQPDTSLAAAIIGESLGLVHEQAAAHVSQGC